MAKSVTGGGIHFKDISKADVSVNIYAFLKAQESRRRVKRYKFLRLGVPRLGNNGLAQGFAAVWVFVLLHSIKDIGLFSVFRFRV